MVRRLIRNEQVANIVEWIISIAAAIILSLFIRQFVFTAAVVSGPSMEPTLQNGDRVIVNRIAIRLSAPENGDIVAFPYPANPEDKHIKRIIGVPGDTVDVQNHLIIINGELFVDYYSPDGVFLTGDMNFPVVIGYDEFFVLGDNRLNSKDSRFASVGLIQRDDIIGSAWFRFIPIDNIGALR